jgi:hypothetical protein
MRRIHWSLGAVLLSALCAGDATASDSAVEAKALAFRNTHGAIELAAPDLAKAAEEDASADLKLNPGGWRYAIPFKVASMPGSGGEWLAPKADGRLVWREIVEAPGAEHLNFGFDRFFLPHGATLTIYALDRKAFLGPYTEADNDMHGEFWTPILPAERAAIELVIVPDAVPQLELELTHVGYGYRGFGARSKFCKSGSCNTDVACLGAGSPWNEPRRSVGSYSLGGGRICTGSLLNNARNDRRMLFATATHCEVTAANAASLVVFWNFEAPSCRAPGSAESGSNAVVGRIDQTQSGAIFLAATNDPFAQGTQPAGSRSDFTLLELDDPPNPTHRLYWSGWDRTAAPAQCSSASQCASIHHPSGDEKRITFSEEPFAAGAISFATGVHWRAAWDPTPPFLPNFPAGTPNPPPPSVTEQGSSGSPLYNAAQRLVGVLSGGPSACGVTGPDLSDLYGQLAHAWEGLGTPQTRMRDHLDPASTGATTIAGIDSCNAPTLALSAGNNGAGNAGENVVATLNIAGQGPFAVAWDVDGDGTTDRRQSNVGSSASLTTVYPNGGNFNLAVQVTDATGCTGAIQRALAIAAPDITATAGTPAQACGDSDGVFEPGEVIRVPVTLRNNGARALNGGFAVFAPTPGASSGGGTTGGSAFGYRSADNTSGVCPFQFVDIGSQPALALTPASGAFGAEDDGRAPVQTLTRPFNFFGATVNQLVMSTNGYLATSSSDTGGDFSADCPLAAPDDGGAGGHLRPLHNDLVVQSGGGLRSQYFASCPRPRDTGGGGGCTVFQWTNMGIFATGGGAVGAAEFQAILYDDTFQIVYQYRAADPQGGGSSGIGIVAPGGSDRQQYACDQAGSAGANRSVCIFHPSALPQGLTPAAVTMDTPAIALNALGPGQEQTVNVQFEPAGQCGQTASVGYLGTVDSASSSMRPVSVFNAALGQGGACAPVTNCAVDTAGAVEPQSGLFANPGRFGNGIGSFVIPTGASTPPTYFGLWFTGERNRNPTWYALQGDLLTARRITSGAKFAQARSSILRFQLNATTPAFPVPSSAIGNATVTYVANDRYVLTYDFNGTRGGEIQSVLYPGQRSSPNRTGAWFFPSQSGWGFVVDDHRINNQPDQVIITYLYDGSGAARWSLGSSSNLAGGVMPQNTFLVHCPTCPTLPDFLGFPLAAGSINPSYGTVTSGTFSSNVTWPAPPLSGGWLRDNVSIQMINPPGAQ